MITPQRHALVIAVFALLGILMAQLGLLIMFASMLHVWRGDGWALLLLPLALASLMLAAAAARATSDLIRV